MGPCMCGDIRCGSCGPAQGNYKCWCCGKWDDEGGCTNREACDKMQEAERQMMTEMEVGFAEHDAAYFDGTPPPPDCI